MRTRVHLRLLFTRVSTLACLLCSVVASDVDEGRWASWLPSVLALLFILRPKLVSFTWGGGGAFSSKWLSVGFLISSTERYAEVVLAFPTECVSIATDRFCLWFSIRVYENVCDHHRTTSNKNLLELRKNIVAWSGKWSVLTLLQLLSTRVCIPSYPPRVWLCPGTQS